MKKAQYSLELVALIAVLLLFFIIVTLFSFNKKDEIRQTENYLDKRNECLRLSNLVSHVYSSGDGTMVNTSTSYLLTLYNHTYVGIKKIANVSQNFANNNIAILVSEAGETTQNFYDTANAQLNPTWYKNCYSDIDGAGCSSSGGDVNYNLIPLNLSNLICDDLNEYNVVYLEDSHIQNSFNCTGNIPYIQKLQDWVNSGNTLISAEHIMCREQSSGSYSNTSYRCNPPGTYNSDVWSLFGHKLHQLGGSFGNPVTIIIDPDDTFFPNLDLNDVFDFEEPSYIEQVVGSKQEAEGLSLAGNYASSTSCVCSSPSAGYCIRSTGSPGVSGIANATWTSNLTGTYEIRVRYCGENDGNDNWTVYKNNQIIDNWLTSGGEPAWQNRPLQDITLNNGDTIKLSCKRGNSNSYCRSDYIQIIEQPTPSFTIVGRYDESLQPAILYWTYGAGRVFYFGDFQVIASQQSLYSGIIADLIESASFLYTTPDPNEEVCFPPGYIKSFGEFTGNIRIKNVDDEVLIENV